MSNTSLQPANAPLAPPPDVGDAVSWTGALAALIGCGVPFANGIMAGWSIGKIVIYGGIASLYLLISQIHLLPRPLQNRSWEWTGVKLAALALLAFGLQAISGDGYIQPIVFTVPIVSAALCYSTARAAVIALAYLLLMALGLLLGGVPAGQAIAPVLGYAAVMSVLIAFTRVSIDQANARRHADELARDLARQRDYLRRLAELTASLARELDLPAVLQQIAAAGAALAGVEQARLWLRDDPADRSAIRLAAAVPPQPTMVATAEQAALLESEAERGPTLVLSLLVNGKRIGFLELAERSTGAFGPGDQQMLQPLANAAAVALHNARLYEQARIGATLAERNRIARELHDTIAQGLTAVNMQLEAAGRAWDRDPQRARERVTRAAALSRSALGDVRRSVWTLAAPLIDGAALGEALADATRRFATRTGIDARYERHGPAAALGHAQATQVLRIVGEALQNVEKHARASAVLVRATMGDHQLAVQVIDNGVGFDPARLPASAASGGFGLVSLRERARLAGGSLRVESAIGEGATITLVISHDVPRSSERVDQVGVVYADSDLDR